MTAVLIITTRLLKGSPPSHCSCPVPRLSTKRHFSFGECVLTLGILTEFFALFPISVSQVTHSHPTAARFELCFLCTISQKAERTKLNISSRGCYSVRPGQSKFRPGEECNHLSKTSGDMLNLTWNRTLWCPWGQGARVCTSAYVDVFVRI